MFRFINISAFTLLATASAFAGAIEIGGANGLTSNYVTQGAGAVCAAGVGNCVAGSVGGFSEKNYDNILFAGASNGTAPVPFTGYAQTGGTPSGSTATDLKGNTFAMISDGTNASNASYNYWQSGSTGGSSTSITVPIGVYDVSDVWAMLNNIDGIVGGNDTSVTFNFGSASNQTSGYTSVTVALENTTNGTSSAGEMRGALACTGGNTAVCNTTTNPQGTRTQGAVIDGVTVNESTVYNSYDYTTVASGFYGGTTGILKLDDLQFVFSTTYASDWLVSMVVTENDGNTGATGIPNETALSAITVDTVVPEPGSILLLLTGLGSLGFAARFRRS